MVVVSASDTDSDLNMQNNVALLKQLREKRGIRRAGIIVNRVSGSKNAAELLKNLQTRTKKKLGMDLVFLGHCIDDEKINQSVNRGKFLIDLYPGDPSAGCFEMISKRLLDWRTPITPWSEVRSCQ